MRRSSPEILFQMSRVYLWYLNHRMDEIKNFVQIEKVIKIET